MLPGFALNNQASVFQLQLFRAVKLQFRLRRIGSGRYLKVIFELALVPVKHQIDSGIKIFVTHAGKLRHTASAILRDRCP